MRMPLGGPHIEYVALPGSRQHWARLQEVGIWPMVERSARTKLIFVSCEVFKMTYIANTVVGSSRLSQQCDWNWLKTFPDGIFRHSL